MEVCSLVASLFTVLGFPLAVHATRSVSSWETQSNPPAHSKEQRTAVPVLLIVLCALSTSAPVTGMSGRKVGVKRVPPFSNIWCLALTQDWYFAVSPVNNILRLTK